MQCFCCILFERGENGSGAGTLSKRNENEDAISSTSVGNHIGPRPAYWVQCLSAYSIQLTALNMSREGSGTLSCRSGESSGKRGPNRDSLCRVSDFTRFLERVDAADTQ